MRETTEQAVLFALVLRRNVSRSKTGDYQIVQAVDKFTKDARILQRLAIDLCNAHIDQDTYDHKIQSPRTRIIDLGRKLGLHIFEFCGDPRGFCVKIKFRDSTTNHMGGETWGVPYV